MDRNLQNILVANKVFEHLGLRRIGVFGSYARGEAYHDIDILLDEDPGYKKRELLKSIIESELKTSCDVVVRNKLEPIILYYINKDLVYVESR